MHIPLLLTCVVIYKTTWFWQTESTSLSLYNVRACADVRIFMLGTVYQLNDAAKQTIAIVEEFSFWWRSPNKTKTKNVKCDKMS